MYRIYRKILNSNGDIKILEKKWYVLEEILGLISGSLLEDQGGFTCMNSVDADQNAVRSRSDFSSRSCLIWVSTVCPGLSV